MAANQHYISRKGTLGTGAQLVTVFVGFKYLKEFPAPPTV